MYGNCVVCPGFVRITGSDVIIVLSWLQEAEEQQAAGGGFPGGRVNSLIAGICNNNLICVIYKHVLVTEAHR